MVQTVVFICVLQEKSVLKKHFDYQKCCCKCFHSLSLPRENGSPFSVALIWHTAALVLVVKVPLIWFFGFYQCFFFFSFLCQSRDEWSVSFWSNTNRKQRNQSSFSNAELLEHLLTQFSLFSFSHAAAPSLWPRIHRPLCLRGAGTTKHSFLKSRDTSSLSVSNTVCGFMCNPHFRSKLLHEYTAYVKGRDKGRFGANSCIFSTVGKCLDIFLMNIAFFAENANYISF